MAEASSNLRELTAVLRALLAFKESVVGKQVQFLSDNITAVTYINRQGGNQVRALNENITSTSLMGRSPFAILDGGAHKRDEQHPSGSSVSNSAGPSRLRTEPRDLFRALCKMGPTRGRPLSHSEKQESDNLFFPEKRSRTPWDSNRGST